MTTTPEQSTYGLFYDRKTAHYELARRLRSVLSHPLCMPLLYALNDYSKQGLPFTESPLDRWIPNAENKALFNGVLVNAIKEWRKDNIFTQNHLTRAIGTECNKVKARLDKSSPGFPFVACCKAQTDRQTNAMDLLFTTHDKMSTDATNTAPCTPLMMIRVGLNDEQWWNEMKDCIENVDMLCDVPTDTSFCFDQPMLLSVVTIDHPQIENVHPSDRCNVRMAVFFCPRQDPDTKSGVQKVKFVMTLLWLATSDTLEEGSTLFGKLLEVPVNFQKWIDHEESKLVEHFEYEYLSRTCCKLGNRVSEIQTIFFLAPQLYTESCSTKQN
jgi:hypothetical protein